jgi:hypothetical protein
LGYQTAGPKATIRQVLGCLPSREVGRVTPKESRPDEYHVIFLTSFSLALSARRGKATPRYRSIDLDYVETKLVRHLIYNEANVGGGTHFSELWIVR